MDAAISPDGKYLGYADQQGIHLQLVATGAVQTVASPPGVPLDTASWTFGSWFWYSTRFIASVNAPGSPSTVWSIPNKILTAESQATITSVVWSPAGNRLAYRDRRHKADRIEIMVQSCDLLGSAITTILLDSHLSDSHSGAFTWTSSGRFIYSRNTELGSAESNNLWKLKVDARSGIPQGKARQLTDWPGFSVYSFSTTADGKQLAFLRGNDHSSFFVGDLVGNDRSLANTRRLTLDDNFNIPSAWMPDSREVIFSSVRAATNRLMYRQSLDQGSSAELITSGGNANFYLARLSPDGASILLEGASRCA